VAEIFLNHFGCATGGDCFHYWGGHYSWITFTKQTCASLSTHFIWITS